MDTKARACEVAGGQIAQQEVTAVREAHLAQNRVQGSKSKFAYDRAGLSTGPPPAPLRREASGPVDNPFSEHRTPRFRVLRFSLEARADYRKWPNKQLTEPRRQPVERDVLRNLIMRN